MSCYHPLPAYVERGKDSAPVIGYNKGGSGDKLELPCGRCIGCRLDRSRAWSIRIGHEAQLYDANRFVTLSYDDDHLPESRSLEYRDFQTFMKRLRKEVTGVSRSPVGSTPIRFFCAGEYGSQFARPHWHAILFNVRFADEVRYLNGTSRSADLDRLWGNGSVVIGDVTPASAAYVAGYTQSKVYGAAGEEFYEDVVDLRTGEVTSRRPPFCTMSRRPGIGAWFYEQFARDLLPGDHAIQAGKRYKVPSYYWRKFQESGDPDLVEDIQYRRYLRSKEVDRNENSERRRSDREQVAWARLNLHSSRNSDL